MSLMQALLQRLLPLFGGLFASQVETGIVLEQAEQLDAIEERARQFEREGKAELAAVLRQQFARIQSDDPARTGLRILANFEEGADSPTPRLTAESSEPAQKRSASRDSKPKRRTRRTARRTAEQSKPEPETSEGEGRSCCDT